MTPDYEAILPLLAKHGIRAVNASPALMDDPARAIEVARRAGDLGIGWSTLPLSTSFYADDTDDGVFETALERLKRWMDVAGRIGITAAYDFIPPGSDLRGYDAQFEFVAGRAARVADIMNEGGIHYGLEFVGPKAARAGFAHPFIHTLDEILKLNEVIGRNTGFVFDVFHWYCAGAAQSDLETVIGNPDKIVTLHLEDAIAGVPADRQIPGEREYPMATGIIPSDRIVRALKKAGYNGVVMAEPFGRPVQSAVDKGLDSLVEHVARSYRRCETEE